MEFNYGLERKRFEREWHKLRQQYRKAGMDENAINEMYAFDLEIFNDNGSRLEMVERIFRKKMLPMTLIFLFCSGSATPASLSRKRSTAST